jgi:hypothetical protein
MAKLLRVHLAGVGHPEARFHPLSLRLDQNGLPMNSVVNLRNAGGKTSLLSLIYAVLLPGKHDFLGKVNSSNRTLDENFNLGKLGVVALEMESKVGRFGLMLGWVRREREDPPTLFSFRTGRDGISFDTLPLQGLNSTPVTTLADLSNWFTERHNRSPGNVDLYIASSFREWHVHLKTQRGVDSYLYRSHLQMNKAEGAVDEEFKFTKTNDFIRRYLEFAVEPPIMGREAEDPVTANLNEHRQALMKQPHYRKEQEFIQEIVPHLQELDGHAQRRRTAEAERNAAVSELQQFADGILFLEPRFRTEQKAYAAEYVAKKGERDELVRKRDNAKRHAAGYDRRGRELRIVETEKARADAEKKAKQCTEQVHLLSAAKFWREVRGAKVKLAALVEQREQLDQELRPELEEVQRRALRLNAAFNEAIETAQFALEEAREQNSQLGSELIQRRADLKALGADWAALSGELSKIKGQIDLANKARERLVTDRIVQPREEVPDAEVRLGAETKKLDETAKTLRKDAGNSRTRAETHRREAGRLFGLAVQAKNLAVQARAELDRFERARDYCAGLESVQEILEGGQFDPFNPGVVEALQGREKGYRHQLLALGIERAEDKRLIDRHDANKHPLFPVAREVDNLLDRLRNEQKIRGILTGYEWLNANLPVEQAQARLRSDPATYGGLVANTPADLEAAKLAFSKFPLSRPVKITLSAALAAADSNSAVTVIPERAGLFNAQAATVERGQIVEHQNQLDRQEIELTQRSAAFADAASQVGGLQKEFGVAWVDERHRGLAENEALTIQHGASAEAEQASAHRVDLEAQRADEEATGCEGRLGGAKTQLAQVINFRNTFGNQLDEWLKRQKELVDQIAANQASQEPVEAHIRDLESQVPGLAARAQKAEVRVIELGLGKSNAKLGTYLPLDIPNVAHGDITTEELPFTTARDTYEEKARKGPLETDIGLAQQNLTNCEGAFVRDGHGKTAEQVAVLSEVADLEIRIETAAINDSSAKTTLAVSQRELSAAEKERPKPLGVNERADLDPGLPEPAIAAEAIQVKEQKLQIMSEFHDQAEAMRELVVGLENKETEARSIADQYLNMGDLTLPARGVEPREYLGFTGNPDRDRDRIRSVKKRYEDARKLQEDLAGKMERIHDNHIDILVKHEKWDRFTVDIRDRLRRFTRADFEANTTQLIQDCNERKSGLEAKLVEIDKVRDTLIDQLYTRANEAVRSLEHAARLSRMPEGVGAWSGQPFLKVHVPARASQAERRVLLSRLMDSWMAPQKKDMTIPRGAELAYECLIAIMNQREIDIEILKPEAFDPLVCNYQPVTKLASFSGGQRVTAAILLYCVIVRVRSDQGDILTDCGFLMLDNPFGKASHFPLVELQLKMANVMGVQLIYMTGINDLEALASFPLRLRLRNSARNTANGERVVQHEPHTVEAVRLGEIVPNGNATRS